MSILRALVLGILQGAAEFLPVSSSGHLVLVPWLLGWESPGLAFDAVVHWGTALAVVVYYWPDWVAMGRSVLKSMRIESIRRGRVLLDDQSRLAWLIILGAIPAAVLGYFLDDFFERLFDRPGAAAGFLLVTALLLVTSERLARSMRGVAEMNWTDALVVGIAQALAIFPGVSRSGATIAAGLTRGLNRELAARYSFLLGTPMILGAGLFKVMDLAQAGSLAADWPSLLVGFVVSGVVGFGCIHLLLRYVRERRLYPFAAYCAVFGVFCLVVGFLRGGAA